ncbi:hypothetical protein MSAN_01537300 [Mycena sanguinolenta]|uniref:Uncharacterized protein n=1 Tax=Mycena sanguinolenta TaxID=230812 RepID=A0A8H6Y6D9_9AGAR|nr:hypothetical protein MSAN_01537300 [Mycena sanguinolenta]
MLSADVENEVIGVWSLAAGETLLYGAYLVMMVLYVQVLRERGLGKNRLLPLATIALFVLCTAHCILVLVVVVHATRSAVDTGSLASLAGQDSVPAHGEQLLIPERTTMLSLAANVIYVTANVLADAIFVFRCYAIWEFQKKIIVFPILLTLGVAGIGYLNVISGLVYSGSVNVALFDTSVGLSLFTSIILMGLSVGRIWVFARLARRVPDAQTTSTYHTVCAMILESGALYVCGGIAFIVLGFVGPPNIDVTIAGAVLGQLVGIAPTIIAVRVARGESVDNVDSFIAPRRSPFSQKAVSLALPPVGNEVLYIRPQSIKDEMV